MTIVHALTSYSGRMSRQEFWGKGIAPLFLATIIPFIVLAVLYGPPLLISGWSAAFSMALLWFQLPVWVKRAHDRNHSGWLLLIWLVPVIGWLWLFVELGFMRGNPDGNRFGAPALPETAAPVQSNGTPNYVPAIALAGHLLLTIVLTVVAIAVVPSARDFYLDVLEGASLPGLTLLTVDISETFTRTDTGEHFGGLLIGLWLWIGFRLYSLANARRSRHVLWGCVVLGLCLNLFVGMSLYLPLRMVDMSDARPSRDFPVNEWVHIKTGAGSEYLVFSYLRSRPSGARGCFAALFARSVADVVYSSPIARGIVAREPLDAYSVRQALTAPDQYITLNGTGDSLEYQVFNKWRSETGHSLTYRIVNEVDRETLGLPRTPPWLVRDE
jgi:uncharacterized membrane protein YhaH (DUF805 family)